MDLERHRVLIVHKSLGEHVLDERVLGEAKAPRTDPMLRLVERLNSLLGHYRIALGQLKVVWVDHLDLDAALEGPFQVVVVLALHQVEVEIQ